MAYLKGLDPADEPRAGALPREPARPGLGVRALDLAGGRVHGPDGRRAWRAVGHSHVALWFHRDDEGKVSGAPGGGRLRAGSVRAGDWLVNPGGVGQPRDGDPRAAWLLLDTDTWTAEWRRVEYPIERGGERDRGGRACPRCSPSASTADSEHSASAYSCCSRSWPRPGGRGLRRRRRGASAIPAAHGDPASRTQLDGRRSARLDRAAGRLQGHPRRPADANDDAVQILTLAARRAWTPTCADALAGQLRPPLGPRRAGSATTSRTSPADRHDADRRRQTETTPHGDRDRDHPDRDPTETTRPPRPTATATDDAIRRNGNGNGNGNGGGAGRRRRGAGGEAEVSPPTEVAGRYVIERRLGRRRHVHRLRGDATPCSSDRWP